MSGEYGPRTHKICNLICDLHFLFPSTSPSLLRPSVLNQLGYHPYFGLIFSVKRSYVEPFPNKPWFLFVCRTSLLKTLWEKEKILVTSNFPLSHSVFYSFEELSAIFVKFEIVVCKLFQFGRV